MKSIKVTVREKVRLLRVMTQPHFFEVKVPDEKNMSMIDLAHEPIIVFEEQYF
jgi:hypothetical protein